MSPVTPLLPITRTGVRDLLPAELKIVRDELDVALAAPADTNAGEEQDTLAMNAEVRMSSVSDH